MEKGNENELNLAYYHKLQAKEQSIDAFSSATAQQKSLTQMYNASCKSLNNFNTCKILEKQLEKYSSVTFPNGKCIFQEKLNKLMQVSEKKSFKTTLDSTKIHLMLKDLPCSEGQKFHCYESEDSNSSECSEFLNMFRFNTNLKTSAKTLPNNIDSFKFRNQGFKSDLKVPENKFNSTSEPKKYLSTNSFKTAREEFQLQNTKKVGNNASQPTLYGQKRKLGSRRNINSKFVSPLLTNSDSNEEIRSEEYQQEQLVDERLKHIEPKMIELIKSEIMDCGPNLDWNDIAGLEFAKKSIQEAVVWPMLRPDIFTGLRRPPKGILLFGPPGTGKTLIGKCVASQSKSTFFSISASSLTSKWIGDGEKMVRALFSVARAYQPAVIFIDEIDSLLSQRSETEHESSRRIKTEFLIQLDGATTDSEERILVIGATNRPQELDEAARRRFVKRLYIPLPDIEARLQLVTKLISKERHCLIDLDFKKIATLSDGYSGADIRSLCAEASLGPIRSIDINLIQKIQPEDVRPLLMEDFEKAFNRVRSSVSGKDLEQYVVWDRTYGSGSGL